jgi:hypothetical protein
VGPADGSLADYAVAGGFKTFRDGRGYFHEGLSLQECIVPVLVLRVHAQEAPPAPAEVDLHYASDRFTAAMVALRIGLRSLLATTLPVRVEAYDGGGPKAVIVGQLVDCAARDQRTGELILQAGEEVQAPVLVNPEFAGSQIEIRVTDRNGAILGRLPLKNARME